VIALMCGAGPAQPATVIDAAATAKQGVTFLLQGRLEQAAVVLEQAAQAYAQDGTSIERFDVLLSLAQAYAGLGHSGKAIHTLELAQVLIQQAGDRDRLGTVLAGLGTVYLDTGQLDAAQEYFGEALAIARERTNRLGQAAILIQRGGLLLAKEQYREALVPLSEAHAMAKGESAYALVAAALVNASKAASRVEQYAQAESFLIEAFVAIKSLPATHEQATALVSWGQGYADLAGKPGVTKADHVVRGAESLEEAGVLAERLGDSRTATFALGYRGALYEREGRHEEALLLTRRALTLALQLEAPEALYQWQWQIGRIARAQGRLDEAIHAYRRTAETLQRIRPELLNTSSVRAAPVREAGGQVFFQLADLLLRRSDGVKNEEERQQYLSDARDAIEFFKAAELRDYFRDDCVDVLQSKLTKMEQVSRSAAVLYPIILQDRVEFLVSLPGGLTRQTLHVKAKTFTETIHSFRYHLENRTTREYLPLGRQLYDWIIRPIEAELRTHKITTLVLVPDGALRTIPLAALHDGKDFLIATYAVATTPGLNLTDPKPLQRENMKVLSAGLTQSVQGFASLPNIVQELGAIEKMFGSRPLLDQRFVYSNLSQEMKERQFSVVHIATHGKFEARPEDSFLLTFDDRLNMDRLSQLIGYYRFRDEPLELLTLSACETAAGDDRAALGLAGLAIKAGARSALATLWFINDEASSVLISEFYAQLTDPTISKAVALQRAQLKLIRDPLYRHPTYWAPFLLLNNWL
jgi:CHAT domain-containing protein/Tfp pilus assembly protein PilF